MTKKELLPLALLIIAFGLTAYFYPTLPAKIATHFNEQGKADGWSPKLSGLLEPLLIMSIAYLALTFYSKLPLKSVRITSFAPYAFLIKTFIIAFFFYIQLGTILRNLGVNYSIIIDIVIISGLFLALPISLGWQRLKRFPRIADFLSSTNFKKGFILWGASFLGVIAIIPFLLTALQDFSKKLPAEIPLYLLLIPQLIQNAVFLVLAVWAGLSLSSKVGLKTPLIDSWLEKNPLTPKLKSIFPLAPFAGAGVAILLILLDLFLFQPLVPKFLQTGPELPIWMGFLASFYGGITEEVLMRFFLMTLLVWLFFKISRRERPPVWGIWFSIVLTSLLFGAGHLPITALTITLTPSIVARALILNGLAGILFGWLYWQRGLEAAIISHFSADIVLLVILPFLTLTP